MKYCPMCDERYDEEIIRFCTKDGAPLIDEEQPSFTAMPSENLEDQDDDPLEQTVIRRKPAVDSTSQDQPAESERIVIPTSTPAEQQVRPRTSQAYYPPPPPPNTVKTVVLTILGTLVVLGFGAGLFWLLQKEQPTNINTNLNANLMNQNTNLNSNLSFDSNFNFNTNSNYNADFNINTNMNANTRTPTPTPTPKASPSASPTPSRTATPQSSPTPRPSVRPAGTQTPRDDNRPRRIQPSPSPGD